MKSTITKTKRIVAAAILLGWTASVSAAAAQIWIFGNGVESGQGRDSTESQAYNDAVTQANAVCPGFIESDYIKTADTCGNLGSEDNPNWVCAVSVKALCRAGR